MRIKLLVTIFLFFTTFIEAKEFQDYDNIDIKRDPTAVAAVNVDELFLKSKEGLIISSYIEKSYDKPLDEISAKMENIVSKVEELNNASLIASKDSINDYDKKKMQLNSELEQYNLERNKLIRERNEQLELSFSRRRNSMVSAINNVANSRSLDLVLDSKAVLFAKSASDITQQAISELDIIESKNNQVASNTTNQRLNNSRF